MNTDNLADGTYPHQELTQAIIGAAFDVHGELGGGFLEKVYENAMCIELRSRGIAVAQQAEMEVAYKGQNVGQYYADLLVDQAVICELKATNSLSAAHQAQLLNYLKATGIKVGLLLNFGQKRVDVKRMVF
jgi:GxxExxY protein